MQKTKTVVKLGKFLLARFNGKVCLTERYHFLAGIAVHHDKVASVTGKSVVNLTAFCTTTYINHFPDLRKMVGYGLLTYFASDLRSFYDFMEVTQVGYKSK